MTTQIDKLQTERIEDLGREGLEEIIREDVQTIQDSGHRLGRCLKTMRDRLFYKPDFETFDSYCEETWGIPKRNADRLITGAVVRADVEAYVNKLIEAGEVSEFAQISLLPVVESHCDALGSVAKELRGEVWLKANGELKPNERLTAKKILEVALKYTVAKKPPTGKSKKSKIDEAATTPADISPPPSDDTPPPPKDDEAPNTPDEQPNIDTLGDFDTDTDTDSDDTQDSDPDTPAEDLEDAQEESLASQAIRKNPPNPRQSLSKAMPVPSPNTHLSPSALSAKSIATSPPIAMIW
jgi:hypothetical protein